MNCPCGQSARCKGFRARTVLGLLGPMRLTRHYYHCTHCGKGHCPLDDALRLRGHDLSPAAEEAACLAGVLSSFAEAAEKTLPRLAGLRLSESTLQRATEAAGARAGEALAEGKTFGPKRDWDWQKDAEGKTVAYVSADATGVPQQGEQPGSAAEGKMAYVGMVYNPVPEDRQLWANPAGRRPDWQACYVTRLTTLSGLAVPLRSVAAQVGMDRAERWVALSDGGGGLEDFLRENFGRVDEVILDFWHAAEYLGKLAQALHPEDEAARQAWRSEWCRRLKGEGGAAVLPSLRGLQVRGAASGVLAEVVQYFENQQHRMDYPRYVAKGWQIGSGPVESACKSVVNARLKGTGMRWGEWGSGGVCHLRALFRSERGQWEAFWNPSLN